MTETTPSTPVLVCDDDPSRFGDGLGKPWTRRDELQLPPSPWNLSARHWVWVGTIGDVETGAQAIEALSRGIALIVHVALQGRDHHRVLEDLYNLGDVRSPEDRRGAPTLDDDQRSLIDLLVAGDTVTSAARQLNLSRRTANRRLAEIRNTLGVATTAEAVTAWLTSR